MVDDYIEQEKVFKVLDKTVEQLKEQYNEDLIIDMVKTWAKQF